MKLANSIYGRSMSEYHDFLSNNKSMIIAPAGYGKTHTIAACVSQTVGKQLILTHTHAGVASIKEKIKKEGIPSTNYHVETITSFIQKYVIAFYCGRDLPLQEEGNVYYQFLLRQSLKLFKLALIKEIIRASYRGIFVDEYQDCTIDQHRFICLLADVLPTHILGDHLQGIFNFKGQTLVNLDIKTEMGEFYNYQYQLETPHRWLYGNNEQLGSDLKDIRSRLERKESIDLSAYSGIEWHKILPKDLYSPRSEFRRIVWQSLKGESVLLLHPVTESINPRLKILGFFNNSFMLIEAIDAKEYYTLAKSIDNITSANGILTIIEISKKIFNHTVLTKWFNDADLKRKQSVSDNVIIGPLKEAIDSLRTNISLPTILRCFDEINKLPDIHCYRRDLFYSLCYAIKEAENQGTSVYDAMIIKRNHIRRSGNRIAGKCIGTTLLTKGLEFDTVIILDAHKISCPKHLYVACTRASKRLIIFSDTQYLTPYYAR